MTSDIELKKDAAHFDLLQKKISLKEDQEEDEKEKEPILPVGDCGVCYDSLPVGSNHVFTVCGHLFCVKCLLTWWDTSPDCPMCRAKLLVRDSDEEVVDWNQWSGGGDDDMPDGQQLPGRPIAEIDRYLYADAGIEWGVNTYNDDRIIPLSEFELDHIRWNREIALVLWARKKFRETLFSEIDFSGELVHTIIPRRNWLELSHFDLGPLHMFEFVMCRTTPYTRPIETNFFGYISQVVVVEVEVAANQDDATVSDSFDEWENTHEYTFIVHVFNPTAPFGTYNVDEGSFVPDELMFRFRDIRRMYSIT